VAFSIAILRDGPPKISRLLGIVEMARRDVLMKAQNGEPTGKLFVMIVQFTYTVVIEISFPMLCVNDDGPDVVVRATFSTLAQTDDIGTGPHWHEILCAEECKTESSRT
jgi:hypothetical protein